MLEKPFSYWKQQYDNDNLGEFNSNAQGLLWLKIKSIARKEFIDNFIKQNNYFIEEKTLEKKQIELYNQLNSDLNISHQKLDGFIRYEHTKQSAQLNTDKLVSELFKLRHFDWGGDYKNALDKYLVDTYVKIYSSYDEITNKFDTEINRAVQGYVLCSWYNHWSSILIEHLFKSHPIVLPTVGQIKKVDFFINNVPFDLKVTYLPANFIEKKRKEQGLKPELTELKQQAKTLGISFTNHKRSDDIYYEIVEKMKNRNDNSCKKILENLKNTRIAILEEARKKSKILIQNLYEEQGELRFDASNRIFLILVDIDDFDNSWKLKRNLELLKPAIKNYLDSFSNKKLDDLSVSFTYKKNPQLFTVLSDAIFIVKD